MEGPIAGENVKSIETRIIDILAGAKYPITVPQILSTLSAEKAPHPEAQKITKKDVNSILYKLKGSRLQIYNEYSPPSWAIIGKFKLD
jgi:hypothetical protein